MVVLYLVSNRMVLSYNRQTTQYNRFSLLNPSSVFFVVFFTLVFAVRYNVGVDFVNYLDEYQSVYKLEYSKNEILYKNIGLFLNSIGAHPSVFFGCFVFLQITFFLLAVKKEIFVLPFLIIFLFANSEIQTWMNIIRSATGMCIWLYAVDFATDRKLWKYVALCIFARSFSLKPEEAEDIVQEVFCRMYDEHRLFEGLNTLKSYLYTAVRNRSFNYLRDEKKRSIREAQFLNNLKAEEEGYNSALENEIYRQLKLLLEELPEQCKNIFQRTLSGDTSEKIAADLKLSVETVKTQRKKAKRILRERYTLLFKTFGILF